MIQRGKLCLILLALCALWSTRSTLASRSSFVPSAFVGAIVPTSRYASATSARFRAPSSSSSTTLLSPSPSFSSPRRRVLSRDIGGGSGGDVVNVVVARAGPRPDGEKDPNNILDSLFTGGVALGGGGGRSEEDVQVEAIQIASRLRSASDLGWTGPPKRRGSTRPRHRAFGGSTELPIQLKPNYDETSPNCVEKWLTLEEFYSIAKTDGPAADTVFVALAGGGAFAEREICEGKLRQWRKGTTALSSSSPSGRLLGRGIGRGKGGDVFDEAAFLKSVQQGRRDLAIGWALFLSLNGFFASSLVFPTNPLMKEFENALGTLQSML